MPRDANAVGLINSASAIEDLSLSWGLTEKNVYGKGVRICGSEYSERLNLDCCMSIISKVDEVHREWSVHWIIWRKSQQDAATWRSDELHWEDWDAAESYFRVITRQRFIVVYIRARWLLKSQVCRSYKSSLSDKAQVRHQKSAKASIPADINSTRRWVHILLQNEMSEGKTPEYVGEFA